MARYGRIKVGSNTNYIKFENVAARREFTKEFEAYHASHEHDGEVPSFEEINTADVNSFHTASAPKWGDQYLTIDGYKANEILAYHRWDGVERSYHEARYRPPSCCISPLVVLETANLGGDGPFVDSGSFERHALSSIFMDMPDGDFENLLKSVEADGFMDNHIRVHEGKILDGWHRYRVALELNIVRKLRFTVWNAEEEGDPAAFVYARNQNRRHHSKAVRAQIAITFHKRFGHGGERTDASGQNDDLKTRQEIADEVGVSTKTIDRATQIEKAGQAEKVISGEKSAGEVLKEEKEKALAEAREKAEAASTRMWQALRAVKSAVHAQNFITAMCQAHPNWGVETIPVKNFSDMPAVWESRFNLVTTQISGNFPSAWVTEFLESEYSELGADRLEMSLDDKPEAEDQPEPDAYPQEADEALWNAYEKRVPKWKSKYAESGFKENQLIQAASDEALFEAYRIYKESDAKGELGVEEIKDLTELMKRASYPFARAVRDLMRAKYFVPEPEVEQLSDTDDTPDDDETQQDHVKRLEELPGEIKAYIPKWIGANPVRAKLFQGLEEKVTLKLLLNARCQIEFGRERGADPFFREEMEELLDAMQTNNAALIEKVFELLEPEPTEADEVSDSPESAVISEAPVDVSDFNYSLENLAINFSDSDGIQQKGISVHKFPSRQLGDIPMSSLPDALRIELLKFVEFVKSEEARWG